MDNETQINQTKRTYFIGSVILVLLILAGFVIYLKNGVKTNTVKQTEAPMVQPTVRPETGSFSLVSGSQTAQVGVETKATVVANTAGKDLVGFDMMFVVRPDKVSGLKVTSLLPDFQVFVKEGKGDVITVTGIRGLSSTSTQILTDVPLFEISFTPKVSGNLELSLLKGVENEATKFVDTATQLFYPKVSNAEIIAR